MISVAMTTYNSCGHTEYLKLQLDSIRKQIVPVDEVVIVDDGSKDNTVQYITEYMKKYHLNDIWHLYRNESNMGFIRSFARALSLVHGNYVLLCDHDDIWLPDKAKIISQTFKENPEILSLNTGFIKIDENGKKFPSTNYPGKSNNGLIRRKIKKRQLNKMNMEDVLVYNISPGCTCAVQKKLIDLYLKKEYQIPHDLELNILAALNNGLYYLDVITTYYRIYSGNTIGLKHENNYEKRERTVRNNSAEKKEIVRLLEDFHADKKYIEEAKDIYEIFCKRSEMLHHKKIGRYGPQVFFRSLKYRFLFESILMDELSILSASR